MVWFSKEIFRKAMVIQFCYVVLIFCACKEKTALLQSPQGEIVIKVGTNGGMIYYRVFYKDIQFLDWSQLGLILPDHMLGDNLHIKAVNYSTTNDRWLLTKSEGEETIHLYNQMVISVEEQGEARRRFDIVFRAFDEGYGFRYEFPIQNHLNTFIVINECTEFKFTANHCIHNQSYHNESTEIEYHPRFLSKPDILCTPLTIETKEGLFLTISETNQSDYAYMHLIPENEGITWKIHLIPPPVEEKIFMKTPAVTPWRMVTITESPF